MPAQIAINENQVLELAKIQCTYGEMAAVLSCSTDTLKRRFKETIKAGREEGKSSLRRMQFKSAEKGNCAMLIWLGKQYLGQTDKGKIEVDDVHAIFTLRGPGAVTDKPEAE